MDVTGKVVDGVPEIALVLVLGILYLPLLVYITAAHVIDYHVLKRYYLKKRKYGLNISCGDTDAGGVNADVAARDVNNFVLVDDVYHLPFGDKQFKSVVSSHTIEHVEDPDRFYGELSRVSGEVVLFVPPVWDIFSLLAFREHKWQFLTLRPKHVNSLPRKVKLPYWSLQKRFGQKLRC